MRNHPDDICLHILPYSIPQAQRCSTDIEKNIGAVNQTPEVLGGTPMEHHHVRVNQCSSHSQYGHAEHYLNSQRRNTSRDQHDNHCTLALQTVAIGKMVTPAHPIDRNAADEASRDWQ